MKTKQRRVSRGYIILENTLKVSIFFRRYDEDMINSLIQ